MITSPPASIFFLRYAISPFMSSSEQTYSSPSMYTTRIFSVAESGRPRFLAGLITSGCPSG
eukprot:jgi/Chrpa1/24681/Chrysochromulina_OHIO_Genome00008148-RA